MALTDNQREKLELGKWINAYFLIEVQGNDKEHVKKALEELMNKFKKEAGVDSYEEKYSEIRELKDKHYAYHIETKFLAKDFNVLVHLALLYSPSVVEIYAPEKIILPIGDAQNILIDIANIVTSLAHALFIQTGKLRKYEPEEAEKSS